MKLYIYFMAVTAVAGMSCGRAENKEAAADSTAVINHVNTETLPAAGDTLSDIRITDTAFTGMVQESAPGTAMQLYGSPGWDKKMIKTADITLQVNNYDSFDNSLHRQLAQFGAYISQERQTGGGTGVENDVTIKVPVQQFERVINTFSGKGIVVKSREVTASEVTAEIQDTKARMEAKKLVRERYMELMGRAGKMKDVLTVQQELDALQENIEATQGRVNYLENQAAYSTIHLRYYSTVPGLDEEVAPGNYGTRLLHEFQKGVSVIGNVLLFLLGIWPLIVSAVIVWVVYKKKWRSWKADKSV